MNDLRKAAEMALEALESWQKTCLDCGRASDELGRATAPMQALRQALNDKPPVKSYCGGKPNYCTPEVTGEVIGEVTTEVPCKTDPRAPHGFNRNASFDEDRYVCDCEFWEPDVDSSAHEAENVHGNVDNVDMSEKRVHKTDKSEHEWVGLSVNEARKFYEKYTNREELIYAIDKFLEEKNGG